MNALLTSPVLERAERSEDASRAERGPLLGNAGGIATKGSERAEKYRERRDLRFRLRSTLWDITECRGTRACGIVRHKRGGDSSASGSGVRLHRTKQGTAYMTGTQTCGKHHCPVCAPKIAEERRRECEAIMIAADAEGCGAYSGLATVPHTARHSLAETKGILREGFRHLWSGGIASRIRERFGIIGLIRTWDITFGESGWHPHVHFILVTDRLLDFAEVDELENALYERWKGFVEDKGLGTPAKHLCRIDPIYGASEATATVRYLTKAATFDITRHDMKSAREGHLSPFEILDVFSRYGDESMLNLWHEYEAEMKGVRRFYITPGLRKRFGVSGRSDEEIAADEAIDEAVESVELTREQWHRLQCNRQYVPYILQVTATHGVEAATRMIDELPRRIE